MTAPPGSIPAAPARPVLLRLIDTDPEPEAGEPADPSPLAALPALDPANPTVPALDPANPAPHAHDPANPPPRRDRPAAPPRRRAARKPVMLSEPAAVAQATAVLRRVLEVLEGRRPARQLGTVLGARVLARLETALRADRLPGRHGLRLRTVRVCQPAPGVIEACAVVQAGARYRAIALRLEAKRSGWTCTALQFG